MPVDSEAEITTKVKKKGMYTSQAGVSLGSCSIKRLGIFPDPPPPSPLHGLLGHRRVTHLAFAGTHS